MEERTRTIIRTSYLGIIANVLIAFVKVVLGVLTSSIAIISEGVNNAADAVTSVLTLVGAKLSRKRPDEKHPFGYGRIEYLTALVVATLIIVSGAQTLISSIKLIFHPAHLSISYLSLAVIAASSVAKFLLGTYTIHKGRETESDALVGVGTECRNDCLASVVTIASALVFLIVHICIDAYAGVITSLFILYAGIGVLRGTVSEILGRPGEKEMAAMLYKEIAAADGIIAAADMMLHSYGPGAYSGSVNVEIDHKKTVGEIYAVLHKLQLRIMHDYKVTMVFGVYAVDNDSGEAKTLRANIAAFIKEQKHIKSFHAVYMESGTGKIYCDFIVDYALKDWEAVKKDFAQYMKSLYPNSEVELTIETEFV